MKKPKLMLIIGAIIIVLVFFLYSLWIPSSQVFWKTMYKTNDSSIMLTFDDGPGPQTPLIVEKLKENNMTATFFVICDHMNSSEEKLIKQMSDEGFTTGLHGQSHVKNEDYNSLKECKTHLENITGKPVLYFRPPYGFKAPRTMNAALDLNMTVVLWSNFPRDYSAKNSDVIVKRVARDLEPGSIICMHDGPENRENTLNSLSQIIQLIKEK